MYGCKYNLVPTSPATLMAHQWGRFLQKTVISGRAKAFLYLKCAFLNFPLAKQLKFLILTNYNWTLGKLGVSGNQTLNKVFE